MARAHSKIDTQSHDLLAQWSPWYTGIAPHGQETVHMSCGHRVSIIVEGIKDDPGGDNGSFYSAFTVTRP